ncbi:TRAP transporter small permease [Nesterenkonia lutea]|uniref:TRAP-type C4-dicarboxylate transport system permease small subunit n=1 Tax=Nesterenkonia lutea TaxID=272919 RepID=A0ABR9JCL9_9MICC|nr:TRAP transporter small permease [Nesterenkonia lutea]MBE1523674.1 TRAP-type C4-dicarboxylate transport system permease small subunit [Nesterenkonia lutea]
MNAESLTKYSRRLLEALAVALIASLVIVVGGSVILRMFGFVPAGSTELATLLFIWTIYIGVFLAFLEGGHLAITAFVNRLRGRTLTSVLIVSDLLLLVFTVAVTFESFNYVQLAMDSVRLTPSLHISPAWGYSAVLVGMLLSSVYVLAGVWTNVVRLVKGQEPPPQHAGSELPTESGA